MICAKKGHMGGEHCHDCIVHQTFKQLGERRRQRNIKLGKFQIRCDTAAIVSLNEFFEDFCRLLGKEKAIDYLIVCMRKGHESLMNAVIERNKKKSQ